jgi:CRISPR-associated protein Cas1
MYFDVESKMPFVYVEMGRLRMSGASLQFVNEAQSVVIPAGRFPVIYIGPGTTVTDGAVKYCVSAGCLLAWIGEDISKCFSMLPTVNQSSSNFLHQVELYTKKKAQLVKTYCELRFGHPLLGWRTLNEDKIRGIEGAYMKKIYVECAKKYGVPYSGRMKDGDWDKNNAYNKGISLCNSYLYGIVTAVLVSMGYSPALGLLHTGNMLSLTFDIADIYKPTFSIPMGFEIAQDLGHKRIYPDKIEGEIRKRALKKLREDKYVHKIVDHIGVLFNGHIHSEESDREDTSVVVGL